jgi:hypothetical protein
MRYEQGPLASYMPFTPHTEQFMSQLSHLKPTACATMHGSTYIGDGAQTLIDACHVMADIFGPK